MNTLAQIDFPDRCFRYRSDGQIQFRVNKPGQSWQDSNRSCRCDPVEIIGAIKDKVGEEPIKVKIY